jgi:hypothetical protein
MFKLPYDNSIGDLINKRNQQHRANNAFDLAELIFGTVDDNDGKRSLKGRVSFAHARSEQPANHYKTTDHSTILNSPKPSYYPNYIVQKQQDGKLQAAQYQTYMNEDAQIRGWKRYPARQHINIQPLEQGQGESVQSHLRPVISEVVRYSGKLRFHNLKKEELGAVIWALTWGNNKNLRHAVGMGKSFGLGQISINVDWDASDIIANRPDDNKPELTETLEVFTTMMSQKISNWQDTDQIKQLLAMADPSQEQGKNLSHMSLNGGGRNNEFILAKGAQRHDKLVLEQYTDSGAEPKERVSAEQEWLNQTVVGLAQQHRSPEKQVMFGKALAEAWQQIGDPDIQAKILQKIQTYWENNGGWDVVHSGKARKLAYKIYTENQMIQPDK